MNVGVVVHVCASISISYYVRRWLGTHEKLIAVWARARKLSLSWRSLSVFWSAYSELAMVRVLSTSLVLSLSPSPLGVDLLINVPSGPRASADL